MEEIGRTLHRQFILHKRVSARAFFSVQIIIPYPILYTHTS